MSGLKQCVTGKQALEELKQWCSVRGNLPKFPELMIEKVEKDLDKLEELTKTPTLEEVKKEWEEKGFNVEVTNRFIYIDRQESNNYFIFDRLELRCHSHSGWTNLELNSLITKTLQALKTLKQEE